MQPVVELIGLTKSFPGVAALREVDLPLQPGRIHALVGENGAGKSTLINVLTGALAPDGGEIHMRGAAVRFADVLAARRAGIVVVHQEVDLFAELTVAENVGWLTGFPRNRLRLIDWRSLQTRTRSALAAVGEAMSPDSVAAMLPPAQRQMVEVAAAVSAAARVLVLDEPTSSLSAVEARTLFSHLRRFREAGTAILYVSHRMDEIFALADDVTVLRDGRRVWHGPVAETSPADLVRKMVGRDLSLSGKPKTPASANPVRFRCENVSAADGSCADVSLAVRGGEILALYGLIGAGRSEWAQTVFGLRPLPSGSVWVDEMPITSSGPGATARHGVAYVPEDRLRQGLCRNLTVRANAAMASLVRLAFGPWITKAAEAALAQNVVKRLDVRATGVEQIIGTLSGGNQQKVVLGRWLERDPAVLILDEPTRGIDVGAKAEIHALIRRLADDGKAVILISSDLPEVLANGDRVGVFRAGRLVRVIGREEATAEAVAHAALPDERPGESAIPGRPANGSLLRRVPREAALVVFIVALTVLLGSHDAQFLRAANVGDVLTSAALMGIVAAGAGLVILAGAIDISLGALMALSAGVAGKLWQHGLPLPLVIAVAVAVGASGGALNAALALVGRVHPIVVTLGMMSVYRGLTLWWIEQDIKIPGEARNALFGEGLTFPPIIWVAAGLFLVLTAILSRTVFGRSVYAAGGNAHAARRVGVSRTAVWLKAFAIQGALAGLAGILYVARSGGLQPTSFEDKTLEAISAAVVGGVAITGGRGTIAGVVLGGLFLVMLGPACQFLHVSTDWQRALVGAVLVSAVSFDALVRRKLA